MEQPVQSAFVIRPMGLGEVLDTGIKLTRQNYRLLVSTAARAIAPAVLVGAILDLLTQLPNIGSFALILGDWLAGIALVFACAHLIAPTGEIGELAPGSLYQQARGRIWPSFVWGVTLFVISIPLFVLFPLGIFLWTRWTQSWVAVILEGDGPIQSLRRSWGLTRRAWWHTFGVLLVSSLVVGIASAVVGGMFGAIGGVLTFAGSAALGGVFTILGNALAEIFVTPFSVAIAVVMYFELRARQEGFDLESRARQQWTVN